MKYLSIILSLYMIALLLIPCQDSKEVSSVENQTTTISQNDNSDSKKCSDEVCPPFCICVCCSVSRNFVTVYTSQVIIHDYVLAYSEYQMPVLSEQAMAIYQPPKVV